MAGAVRAGGTTVVMRFTIEIKETHSPRPNVWEVLVDDVSLGEVRHEPSAKKEDEYRDYVASGHATRFTTAEAGVWALVSSHVSIANKTIRVPERTVPLGGSA